MRIIRVGVRLIYCRAHALDGFFALRSGQTFAEAGDTIKIMVGRLSWRAGRQRKRQPYFSAIRMPESNSGNALGTTMSNSVRNRLEPSARADHTSVRSVLRAPL